MPWPAKEKALPSSLYRIEENAIPKRIILGYMLFFSVLVAVFFGNRLYLLQGSYSQKYHSENDIATVSKTQGKNFLVYDEKGYWKKMFVAGVNLGSAKPGSYPGELAITKQEYLRWFQYISDMNANTIRVYTLMMPVFYEALREFNETALNPLYLMQGVYNNEADIAQYQDAYAQDGKIKADFNADIKRAVDIIHGNATLEKLPGNAGGVYKADVSQYVIGWILGIEWDSGFVISTNVNHPLLNNYDGTYVKTNNASPFEAFLAEAADTAVTYETLRYKEQRPVAICNWVTTDPLSHPNEPNPKEDAVSVDVEHLLAKSGFEAGFFASYHIYPYYPDMFSYEVNYQQGGNKNTYAAYLKELDAYHSVPVLIAEVGIPASRGIAHENILTGFNQGNVEESEQGRMLASLIGDIKFEGCMGALIFSWDDEWFKTTWNTMDLDLKDSRAYWLDYQTNEQNFGLLAFDPGETATAATVDGDVSEWKENDLVAQSGDTKLYVKSDEEFVYLKVNIADFNHDTLYIPIDTITNQGNTVYKGINLSMGADFMLVISGRDNSNLLVDPYYDVTYYEYGISKTLIARNPEYENTDTGKYVTITQVLNRALSIPQTGQTVPFSTFDAGKLRYGNANPNSSSYDSLSDIFYGNGCVEIRIPWLLLNVMDPSSKKIIGNMYQNQGIQAQDVEGFTFGIASQTGSIGIGRYTWQKWEQPTYHERLKKSYFIMKNYFATLPSVQITQRTGFELFWLKWNQSAFSKIATWFPIQPVLNYMIAFMLSLIVYFILALLYIHTQTAIRERRKQHLKASVTASIHAMRLKGKPVGDVSFKLNKMRSPGGLAILSDLFEGDDEPYKKALRELAIAAGYERYLKRRLKGRNIGDLIIAIRLAGELQLAAFADDVMKLLYQYKDDIDLQYQGLLTLAQLAGYTQIVRIAQDKNYIQTLSFRSLQEIFKVYAGDKYALYGALLDSPDMFVRRICIKRIGIEGFAEFAPRIQSCLDGEDFNMILDAARTLGQLKYAPAAPKLIELLSHKRWEVRSIAAAALAGIDLERYAPQITNVLFDREWQVRYNAAKALAEYSDIDKLLVTVKQSGDKYAYEILEFMASQTKKQVVL